MKRSPESRKRCFVLSDSLNHRLNMYVLSAGAAGVGMLALTQPAEARIVYTRVFKEISLGKRFLLDLNHDGVHDFGINVTPYKGTGASYVTLFAYPAKRTLISNQVWRSGCFHCAAALPAGVRVGGSGFSPYATIMAGMLATADGLRLYSDSWANGGKGVRDRYLGLQFAIGNQIHYGWARLNVSFQPPKVNIYAVLTGYAYETIPNKPIITGDTGPAVDEDKAPNASLKKPVPPPASLGLLALGAPGLEIWRREDQLPANWLS